MDREAWSTVHGVAEADTHIHTQTLILENEKHVPLLFPVDPAGTDPEVCRL